MARNLSHGCELKMAFISQKLSARSFGQWNAPQEATHVPNPQRNSHTQKQPRVMKLARRSQIPKATPMRAIATKAKTCHRRLPIMQTP